MKKFEVILYRPTVIMETCSIEAGSEDEAILKAKENQDIEWELVQDGCHGLCQQCDGDYRYEASEV